MGVSSTQVGDHWGSARTVQPAKHYFPCEDDDLGQAVPCGDHQYFSKCLACPKSSTTKTPKTWGTTGQSHHQISTSQVATLAEF
jgi:hypothetical protein